MAEYKGITLLDIMFRDAENISAGDHTFICGDEIYPTEVIVYDGDQDWTSSMNLGNSTADSRMLICIVKGDLIVRSGITVTPTTRKRGFFLFCTGIFSNFGNISMTARGASAVGQNVYIWCDKESFDFIPRSSIVARAAGVYIAASNGVVNGNKGSDGVNRLPGNGGSGSVGSSWYGAATSGGGGLATSYSGGPGGGGASNGATGIQGSDTGGAGGTGLTGNTGYVGAGGAGNPAGTSGGPSSTAAVVGTGGLLIIFAKTVNLMSSGIFSANGSNGGYSSSGGSGDGGSSGGGSINIFFEEDFINSGTITVNGGTSNRGGAGGKGSISSKQIIPHYIEDWRFPHFFIKGTSILNALNENVITHRTGAGFIETETITWPCDIVVYQGNQIWNESLDLGLLSNNQEERALVVIIKGNLTIDKNTVIKAKSDRRAFIFMVFGHLIIDGTLNLTTRQELKTGTISIFTGKDIQIDVPSNQRAGVSILYATRITNNGELIVSGNWRELYYQGLLKEGKCTITASSGAKDTLVTRRILKDMEVETKQIVGELT